MSIDLASTRRSAAVLLCALSWCCAQARDTGTDPSLIIEKNAQSYVINLDGSYALTVDDERSIAQERAVGPHSQFYIAYNQTLDQISDVAAYTQKPDGRRIAVGADQIKDQQESVSADAPMFQDTRVKVVVFPDVAVGDRLVLHYVLKRNSALFPGQFEDLSSSRFYQNKQYSLSYDLPAGMKLYSDAVGFNPAPVSSAAGRERYRWEYVAGENERIESESVSYLDYGKRLAVSTFADYGAFARAFQARAQDMANATPQIEQLARQLTAGLPDARSKALALSDWVRKNIRYVGVYIGPGGVVPHPAATVLDNRYGDCKDHASLLEAMLGAVGIDSSGALINGGNVYRLPRTPTLGIFNHMITYVPSLDLYLDSTAESVAAGDLPAQELGKPVLLTKSGRLAKTPAFQIERNKNFLEFQIGKSGNTLFRVAKTTAGAIAEPYRQAIRDTKQADRDMFVERMLTNIGQKGYGVFDPGKLNGTGDEYQVVFAGISENFANLPGPTGISTSTSFWGGIADAVYALVQEKERTQEFICAALDNEEEARFNFAPDVKILALPKKLVLHGADFDYQANYVRKGNSVTVRRHVRFRPDGMVCSPADFTRMRPLIDRAIRDLKSQIIVQAR